MNLVCFGLSHREAPVEIRERFALGEGAAVEAAQRLRATAGTEGEAVAVSTCNRTEFYAVTPAGMGARELCAAHFLDPSLTKRARIISITAREGREWSIFSASCAAWRAWCSVRRKSSGR